MFAKQASLPIEGYVVWVPKAGGTAGDVPDAMNGRTDPRLRHYWDGGGLLVKSGRGTLGLGEDCWDVYLLYDRDARWDGDAPPKPTFWMHQLGDQVNAPTLDAEVFAQHTRALVSAK